jgi:hypothetical protein
MERPNIAIRHSHSKRELEEAFFNATGKRFEDSDRAIRKLHDEGKLVKLGKGTYMYDPNHQPSIDLQDFSPLVKNQALERDEFKCVICGLGKKEGVELQIDHVLPRSKGGDANLENAQTLCAAHNFSKKNLSQMEHGKKMFLKLKEKASRLTESDEGTNLLKFCEDILAVYDKHSIDSHID